MASPVLPVKVFKVTNSSNDALTCSETDDLLAIEEPLGISLLYYKGESQQQKNISVTMCTPGNDIELATGFLFTEGIICKKEDVISCIERSAGERSVLVELRKGMMFDPQKIERHFYTSSSCGVCGKSSVDAVKLVINKSNSKEEIRVHPSVINQLPALLRKEQEMFEHTGGLHASALFGTEGKLLLVREDVGRHNALDKLIGSFFLKDELPLGHHILLLSGRASFELLQKAAMAGIRFVCAVGAPSSLAVEIAKELDITLIGFLRDGRFNIYAGEKRVAG